MRLHEIADGGAFTQELGAGDHPEGQRLLLVGADDIRHPVAGADGDGGLVDDDEGGGHVLGDGAGGGGDIAQVGFAIHAGGRAHGDEDELAALQAFGIGGGKGKATGAHVALHQLMETRLVDGHLAALQAFDLFFVDVQGDDAVAQIGEAGGSNNTDITDADHADLFHFSRPPLKFGYSGGRNKPKYPLLPV